MVAIPLYRFQIMKANGNALVVPNIVEGHSWSADKVKAICKTTHLYIRALRPLVSDERQPHADEEQPPAADEQQPPAERDCRVPPAPVYVELDSLDSDDSDFQSPAPWPARHQVNEEPKQFTAHTHHMHMYDAHV